MKFTFNINPEGMLFIKENESNHYPNVEYDENQSTIGLELPVPNRSTIGQFMSVIKNRGLLIGKKDGNLIILDSRYIIKYPYELEEF